MAELLLGGAFVAGKIMDELRRAAQELQKHGVTPRLAILRVGVDADDIFYERSIEKCCAKVGVEVCGIPLPRDVQRAELIAALRALNADASIHGVLPLIPAPAQPRDTAVYETLALKKDVDGVTYRARAALYSGENRGFAPCTACACVEMLRRYKISTEGKHVVIVGRSTVAGKPAAMLLLAENATVTVCHSRTVDLPEVCRKADILIAAAGQPGLIGREHVRAGQVVLDVGTHMDENGIVRGDVRFDEVAPIVSAITPVPGGVGAVTTPILAAHTVEAAKHSVK